MGDIKRDMLSLTLSSSVTDLCEVNSSFDSGVLRIAYPKESRNKTYISKETFERCINTIYNCPVACNYDRETDSLGGHDVEVIRDKDGGWKLVRLTNPVGVIPMNARVFWETVTEQDGTEREYLCSDVLIWKRQEAYEKIKNDGVVAQSMEIYIKDGEKIDGIYHIYDFEFNAFVLIGCEPCFESASLSFSEQDFMNRFSEMMFELKEGFTQIYTEVGVDHKYNEKKTEGGTCVDKNELIMKYGFDVNALDFSIDELTYEELEAKLQSMSGNTLECQLKTETTADADDESVVESAEEAPCDRFALTENVLSEIRRELDAHTVMHEWGQAPAYSYVDSDIENHMVYVWDRSDWLLYGFAYSVSGDAVIIDFDSKKRMKYVIAEFEGDEQQDSPFVEVFNSMGEVISDGIKDAEKYSIAEETINSMQAELEQLREFKNEKEQEYARSQAMSEREEIFKKFEDLSGNEFFESLVENCLDYSLDDVEEKCYALRGRFGTRKDAGSATVKTKVQREPVSEARYGGVFEKYGFEPVK